MRVIHGVWAQGALGLWAEDPELPQAAGAGIHPFACQAAEIADLLTGAGRPGGPVEEAARKAVEAELTLRLPSAGSGSGSRPLPSPELVRSDGPGTPAPGRGRVTLAGWRVPVLAFG